MLPCMLENVSARKSELNHVDESIANKTDELESLRLKISSSSSLLK